MTKRWWFLLAVLTVLTVVIYYWQLQLKSVKPIPILNQISLLKSVDKTPGTGQVHVAMTACGDRLTDVLIMTRSLALTAANPIVLHAFLEKKLQDQFMQAVNAWPDVLRRKLDVDIRDIFFPTRALPSIPPDFWSSNQSACAYQKLFLPEAFPKLDKLIFVDADIVFLSPVQDLWNQMTNFDTNQYMGITLEQNTGGPSFYLNFKDHPLYRGIGLNTGVILYDLKKINRTQFLLEIHNISVEYKTKIRLADQGVLNILFHFYPERVFEISCAWNYRSDFCAKSTCKDAQENGIRLLHGNRRIWYNNMVPPFKSAFVAYRDTPIKNVSVENVLVKLKGELSKPVNKGGICRDKHSIFTIHLQRIVDSIRDPIVQRPHR